MHTISNFIYGLEEEEEGVVFGLFFRSMGVEPEYATPAPFSVAAEEAEAEAC